jgi:2-haloacid dehalogenase
MPKSYTWLLFDADGTLFDYDRAEGQALQKTLAQFGLPYQANTLAAYQKINSDLWKQMELGRTTPAELQVTRFAQLFDCLGLACSAEAFNQSYLVYLADSSELIAGADKTVHALRSGHSIAILTNGLRLVQRKRLAASSIHDCIDAIVISDEVGAAKPYPAYYDAAFRMMGNPPKDRTLMIGDSLTSDILGGVRYGIDTCWFNPRGLPRPADLPITYEIRQLVELVEIVNG